jgi:hypothetical protein
MGEEKAKIGESGRLPVGLRGGHQGPANLDPEVVVLRAEGSQGQQKAAAGAADVEVEGPLGIGEELRKGGERPRQLMEAAEGIDVLPHHQSLGTRKAQQAV